MNQHPVNRPEEEDDDIIELVDEEGETTRFEHLATLEYKGESYLALCDPDADENDEKGLEVFILKIDTDDQGQDVYTIPEDDVSDQVYEQFLKLVDETMEEE